MKTMELEERWGQVSHQRGIVSVKRIDNKHILDIYLGYDEQNRKVLVIITKTNPNLNISSKSISVSCEKRDDDQYATALTLIQLEQKPAFIKLVWDLIEYTRKAESVQQGLVLLQNRFLIWQKLLQKGNQDILQYNVVKGLIGELIFLKNYCLNKYGDRTALEGWIGPEGADKDFVYADAWFEVKAVDPSISEVKISSLEQLQGEHGYLVIINISKTSTENTLSITLPKIIESIIEKLGGSIELKTCLEMKLAEVGYFYDAEYDKIAFDFHEEQRYSIKENFPRITRDVVPEPVSNLTYCLSISALEEWRVENA